MKCPYCNNPGIPREIDVRDGESENNWICVKCPNPVTYSVCNKKIAIWALYNNNWYSIVYLPTAKEYIITRESFDLRSNLHESREEFIYTSSNAVQVPSEQTITPTNATEKLALLLTFS